MITETSHAYSVLSFRHNEFPPDNSKKRAAAGGPQAGRQKQAAGGPRNAEALRRREAHSAFGVGG
jgi:hypothetical protein